MIFRGRGRPQGNRDKTDLRLFPKNHDFSRSGPPAGQRGQKLTFVYFQKITIFQGRRRPQGNGDKTDLRLFPKNHDFSRSGQPAGQRGQNWPSFISKKSRFFKVGAARRATGTKLTFVYFQKITIFQGRGALQVFKIWPPDRILEYFLYHSELFWPVCPTGSLRIVRKP